jgi:hypothetical protein
MAAELAARKFNRAKWTVSFSIKDGDAPADAVTVCLRTTDNQLSFWNCTKTITSVEDVVLALATGSKVQYIEKMHVVGLSKKKLVSKGLSLQDSEGDTAVEDLKSRHFDIIELTLNKLTKIARLMSRNVSKDILCFSFTRTEVTQIIQRAISEGKLALDNLPPSVQTELARLADQ